MYRIGEFSHLCETTIKTLRHYDKINLLKPSKVDDFTGYRYYEEKQIKTLEIIKDLQYAGFSLKEIKNILNEDNYDKFNKQIENIKKENSKKIMILQKMKNNMTKQAVELITNPNFLIVGKITTIKERDSIQKVLEQIDKNSYLLNPSNYMKEKNKLIEQKENLQQFEKSQEEVEELLNREEPENNGIVGYQITTSNIEPTKWIKINKAETLNNKFPGVTKKGTYYICSMYFSNWIH